MAAVPTFDEPTRGGDEPVGPDQLPGWLAIVLVVGTSAAVLVLEILAGRLLAPYVGVSLNTYTGIIGTVLAGIAIGAGLGGVAADRFDPRRLYPAAADRGRRAGDRHHPDDSGSLAAPARRRASGRSWC